MPLWLVKALAIIRALPAARAFLQALLRKVTTMSQALEALAAQVAATTATDSAAAAKISELEQKLASALDELAGVNGQVVDLTTQLKTAQEALAAAGK